MTFDIELEDDYGDDAFHAAEFGGLTGERLRQALELLKQRGIKVRSSWLPLLLAIIAALPDLIAAIEKFISIIRPPAPPTT